MRVLELLKGVDKKGMYLDMLTSDLEQINRQQKDKGSKSFEQGEIVGNLSTQLVDSYGASFISATIKEVKSMVLTSKEFREIDTPSCYQRKVMEILTKIEFAFLAAEISTEQNRHKINEIILEHYNVVL